nr:MULTISPECIES: nucleotide disphospho-sugar-binding domain-containing protein [unclassified Mesorhizobium]
MTRKVSPTIALFPEAGFGAALNCVGIARAVRGPAFIFHAGLSGVFADKLPARFIVNVGGLRDAYRAVPDNVYLGAWFPQSSAVAKLDLFIHHGGNTGFCEALRFCVASLIMPYCRDGHDNAPRAEETGTGDHIGRDGWTEGGLERAIPGLLADHAMRARLKGNAARWR